MAQVIWGSNGRKDVIQIAEYLSGYSETYASALVTKIYRKVGLLANSPRMGKIVPEFSNENIRQLLEGDYRIIYELFDNDVAVIIKVIHTSRNLQELDEN
ncbi:MAG: type II toxin-antitoxin system RelE/ParE family toxin [Sphingobacteriaceae bacterium]|nr:type II toxin-antitoxin system RelE/ParE family toxin [Cytophagaceae bacterium]